jgi:hypothetical protein
VFLFSRETIGAVLASFAELVGDSIGTGLPCAKIRAVGAVQKEKSNGPHFPETIGRYWADFVPKTSSRLHRRQSLRDHLVAAAQLLRGTEATAQASRVILEGVSRMLQILPEEGIQIDRRPHLLLSSLNAAAPKLEMRLRMCIASICQQLCVPESSVDEELISGLTAVIKSIRPVEFGAAASAFWKVNADAVETRPAGDAVHRENVFAHAVGEGTVEVSVGTIHSVKGETLTAVMILDTVHYEQHLVSLLKSGYFSGRRPRQVTSQRASDRLTKAFVAASRPTDLLCLAMHSPDVSEQHRRELERSGWKVVEL